MTAMRNARISRTKGQAIDPAIRKENIGRLVLTAYRHFEHVTLKQLHNRGFSDLRMPHFQILVNLIDQNVRSIAIASQMGITRQAVSQVAADLEDKGYLDRLPDPDDKRANILQLTAKGQSLLAVLPEVVFEGDKTFREILGDDTYTTMVAGLRRIAQKFDDTKD